MSSPICKIHIFFLLLLQSNTRPDTWATVSQIVQFIFVQRPFLQVLTLMFGIVQYRNDPKFSDRQVWVNSVDPDQTAPRGTVWSGSTLFVIPSAPFGCIILWWSHVVQILGWLQQCFCMSEFLGFLRRLTKPTCILYWCEVFGQTDLGKLCRPKSDFDQGLHCLPFLLTRN